jgi:hypothetical protein
VTRPIDLRAAPTQTVEILASGPGLANLGPALLTQDFIEQAALPPDMARLLTMSPDEVAALPLPDVVELFALAVSHGFFGSAGTAPAAASSSTQYDAASSLRAWILNVSDTPPRALRVLLSLLDGLDAESLALRTAAAAIPAAELDLQNGEWPGPPVSCPFRVELEDLDALVEADSLSVRLEAQRALSGDERAAVDRCFEIWTNILLLGGYLDHPLRGTPPVGPEPGQWENDRTWVQGFEIFRCAPQAVFAVLHFTTRLAQVFPVRRVEIHT